MKWKIENRKIEDLIPFSGNPKEHPDEQVDKIAASIKRFGFKVPMLITEDNEIIAGHGRLKAAKKLDLDKVPVIVADDLSEAEVKAFRIADNKLTESDWDMEQLSVELEGLEEMDFDLDLTGFDEDEIESIQMTESELFENTGDLEEEYEEPEGDSKKLKCPKCGEISFRKEFKKQ